MVFDVYDLDYLYTILGGTNDMDEDTFFSKFKRPILSIPSFYTQDSEQKYPILKKLDKVSYCSKSELFSIGLSVDSSEDTDDTEQIIIQKFVLTSLFHSQFNPIQETQNQWIKKIDSIIPSFPQNHISQMIIDYLLMSPLRFHQDNIFCRPTLSLLWQNCGTQIRLKKKGASSYVAFNSTKNIKEMGSWSMSVVCYVPHKHLRFGIFDPQCMPPHFNVIAGYFLEATNVPLQFRFRCDWIANVVRVETDTKIFKLAQSVFDVTPFLDNLERVYFFVNLCGSEHISVP